MKPGDRVNRRQEAAPRGAVILEVRWDHVLLEYEEGGQGWWTLDFVLPVEDPNRPNYQAFYDSLLVSSCYEAALGQVMGATTPAPAAALAVLISAIQDALNGRPNPPALQASIWLLLGQITLSQEHLAELQGLLVAAHLDGLLSLTPPAQQPAE